MLTINSTARGWLDCLNAWHLRLERWKLF